MKVGSKIDVFLEKIENKNGEIVVSREKARRAKSWKKMEKAFENKEEIQRQSLFQDVKGGFVCECMIHVLFSASFTARS